MIALKHYQYGLDVIVAIGHQHFINHKPLDEIKPTLGDLQISRAEIYLLTQVYLALTQATNKQTTPQIEQMKKNGGILLSLDGVQPEKGNQTLWILRDQQTNTTLLAQNLQTADKTNITKLIQDIKKLGVPIIGVISDGQKAIRAAIKQELPTIPHQLCQFHFLRNIAKPIADLDRALKVELKKTLQGLNKIEQQAAKTNDKQSPIILKYCQTLRFALQDDAKYPLSPAGTKLYTRLQILKQSLMQNQTIQTHTLLSALLDKLSALEDFEPKYRRIRRLYALVHRATNILNQNVPRAIVEAQMHRFFCRVAKGYKRYPKDREILGNMLKFLASHWSGLFYHYDFALIPRTNNDLERFIRSLKVSCRKISGRASTQSYILRYGAYVALFEAELSLEVVVGRFGRVGYGLFVGCYAPLVAFRAAGSFKRALALDFKGCVSALGVEWNQANNARSKQ